MSSFSFKLTRNNFSFSLLISSLIHSLQCYIEKQPTLGCRIPAELTMLMFNCKEQFYAESKWLWELGVGNCPALSLGLECSTLLLLAVKWKACIPFYFFPVCHYKLKWLFLSFNWQVGIWRPLSTGYLFLGVPWQFSLQALRPRV